MSEEDERFPSYSLPTRQQRDYQSPSAAQSVNPSRYLSRATDAYVEDDELGKVVRGILVQNRALQKYVPTSVSKATLEWMRFNKEREAKAKVKEREERISNSEDGTQGADDYATRVRESDRERIHSHEAQGQTSDTFSLSREFEAAYPVQSFRLEETKSPRRGIEKVIKFKTLKEYNCTICLQEMTRTNVSVVLPCFHRFCYHCICRWLHSSSSCAICKAEVDCLVYSIRNDQSYKIRQRRDTGTKRSTMGIGETLPPTKYQKES
eukprot:TRINITY_DN10302_c0_g1_i2.p1 TRINITY_DN10302_c0_g1~~TRINITY_DN10302_c0_g1_i2.p1  ORF type:complete len:265 (-),score=50.28 TRINITY_DN10302_c0_g1_i2:354-1148(-)